ncbi:MAG: hypothetical protein Harvfovirus8_10 [Harvfovirus sp.]|uniref:Hemerythrin-like domain-containing protein n=1 Tax=Harvfovirus sp. TaxID=2487768 RepID=A0A3G5A5U0_9VIRU|nr:MAG: hypothetical protein Harvfovirus8_10 [Harvfovirus sp.]
METSAVEDLMREHGLLNRLLLIYEECISRISSVDRKIIYYTATIIQQFVENYHEKTEEKYVFPLLKKVQVDVDLVDELLKQHELGRVITNKILGLASSPSGGYENELVEQIQLYVKMYRYHESREDTVVFQDFKKSLSVEEYKKLGELFEKEEDEILGPNGYEIYLDMVITLEKKLGIYDLANITKYIEKSTTVIEIADTA